MVAQPALRSELSALMLGDEMPNLIFHGTSGACKSAAATALLRSKFGADFPMCVLELNASDERNLKVLRDRVAEFTRSSVLLPSGAGVQRKVVVLDESDSLTPDSQAYLRHVIEASTHTRFVLVCNYIDKIHEALRSRCCVIFFPKLLPDAVQQVVSRVCAAERLQMSAEALALLVDAADGDLRRALTLLQTAATFSEPQRKARRFHGSDISDTAPVGAGDVCRAAGRPTPEVLREFLASMRSVSLRASCASMFELQQRCSCPLPDVLWALYNAMVGADGAAINPREPRFRTLLDRFTVAETESMTLGSEDKCVLAYAAAAIWRHYRAVPDSATQPSEAFGTLVQAPVHRFSL
jgi:DNA polymerase III delta prime subunit